jgi:apurinic endonuclease APN1
LMTIIERIDDRSRIGIALDTCHLLVSGYDFRDPNSYVQTISKFNSVVGIQRVNVIHLNDSRFDIGSNRDGHTQIGKGFIGIKPLAFFLNDPCWKNIPMTVELLDERQIAEGIRLLKDSKTQ